MTDLLSGINSSQDLKSLTTGELIQLSEEIRKKIIEVV